MTRGSLRAVLVLGMAVAGPTMLLLDFVLRHFVFASQPADVRSFLADHLTPIAWCIVPLPVLGGIFGYRLYPSRVRASEARWQKDATLSAEQISERADFEALFLTTSLAQLPAVLGDLSLILGAGITPALCSTAAAAASVIAIGLFAHGRSPER